MIKLICGRNGSGKTKKIIELANDSIDKVNGDIVFIDKNKKNMFEINHKIRFINAMDFDIKSIEEFYGFLCGIISEDYDIKKIFIDGIYKIIDIDKENLNRLISRLENLLKKFEIEVILSINLDIESNEELKEYIYA